LRLAVEGSRHYPSTKRSRVGRRWVRSSPVVSSRLPARGGTGGPQLLRQAHFVIPPALLAPSFEGSEAEGTGATAPSAVAEWRDRGSIPPQSDDKWVGGASAPFASAVFWRRALCKGWPLSPHSFSSPTLLFSENSKLITEYLKLLPLRPPTPLPFITPQLFSKVVSCPCASQRQAKVCATRPT